MAFASYNEFRNAVLLMVEGEHSTGSVAVDTVDLMIALAEDRIYLGGDDTPALRAATMETALNVAVSGNAAPLPADFLELKNAYFSGYPPLEIITLDRLLALEAVTPTGGQSAYVADAGNSLRFYPLASGNVLGTYYKKQEPLKTGTWANQTTFARYPMVFLYGAVAEVCSFLGDDATLEKYEGKFRSKLRSAMATEQTRVTAGSKLRIRAR